MYICNHMYIYNIINMICMCIYIFIYPYDLLIYIYIYIHTRNSICILLYIHIYKYGHLMGDMINLVPWSQHGFIGFHLFFLGFCFSMQWESSHLVALWIPSKPFDDQSFLWENELKHGTYDLGMVVPDWPTTWWSKKG